MGVLSRGDATLVAESWKLLAPDLTAYGAKFFKSLFKHHPKLQQRYFPNIPEDDTDAVGHHGARVLGAIGRLVDAVGAGDDERLIRGISITVERHVSLNVGLEQFKLATPVLHELLVQELGDQLSPEAAEAWQKFLDAFIAVVTDQTEKMRHN